MGRKKKKKARSGGGQNPLGLSVSHSAGSQPPVPNGRSPLDKKATYGLLGSAGGMMWAQFGVLWWTQAASLCIAIGIVIFVVLRSDLTEKWRLSGKAAAIAFVFLAALIFPGRQVYANYFKEHRPEDDLLATFTVKDPNQLGSGEIDFSVNFINRGSRAVTIKDLGAFVAYRMADAFHMVPPCSISNLRPESVDVWYGITGLNKGSRVKNDDLTLYSTTRSTLDSSAGVSIPARSNRTVPAHVFGLNIRQSGADETYLCPIIRYADFDGIEKVVVCDAYHFRKDGDRTRYPGGTNKPVRLLPHAENSECVSDDIPADTHVTSKEEQALP